MDEGLGVRQTGLASGGVADVSNDEMRVNLAGFGGEFDYVDGSGSGVNDGADESWGPKLDGRTTGCILHSGQDLSRQGSCGTGRAWSLGHPGARTGR